MDQLHRVVERQGHHAMSLHYVLTRSAEYLGDSFGREFHAVKVAHAEGELECDLHVAKFTTLGQCYVVQGMTEIGTIAAGRSLKKQRVAKTSYPATATSSAEN